MSASTPIEWTATVHEDGTVTPGATWNPTTGCQQISPGCDRCYARTLAGRFWAHQYPPNADGSLRQFEDVRLHTDRLMLPFSWRQPRRVFVDSMSDLFNDDVPEDFIAQVFGVMAFTPEHTFQVLTKRPQRMRAVMERMGERFAAHFPYLQAVGNADRITSHTEIRWGNGQGPSWPLPNVWLGVSIELNRYCWRANYLRETPAAVRFISAEPLLGPLPNLDLTGLDWIITGGESGPGHRPCDPQWVRDLRDRCQAAHIAFFHKQWGGQTAKAGGRLLDGRTHDEFPAAVVPS